MLLVHVGLSPPEGPRYSQAVLHNGTAYLAGQTASDPSAPIGLQIEDILAKIDGILARCGTDKTKLISVSIMFADLKYYEEVNNFYNSWLPPCGAPIRAASQVGIAKEGHLFAIHVVAAV